MIDLCSGAVVFDDCLSIDAQSPLTRMKGMHGAKLIPSVVGRTQLSMGSHTIRNENWGVGLVYVQSKLHQVWLQHLNADGVNATVWSLENEKLRKVAHDTFVKQLCTSNYNAEQTGSSVICKLPWGKVSSVLDVKGIQALVLVEYFG